MLEKQTSVAFEVTLDDKDAVAAPPTHIAERIQKFNEERSRRTSISREEIEGKLYDAAEKKKQLESERIAKATRSVEHAKSVASLSRQSSIENLNAQLAKIEDKLSAAADSKAEQERQRLAKIEEHLERVQARKSGSLDAKPELLETDLLEQLNAAESRRKALEASKVEKLAEHFRHVEEVKGSAAVGQMQHYEVLMHKLTSADERRSKLEKEALKRLASLHEHVEEVQRRKAQIAPAAL